MVDSSSPKYGEKASYYSAVCLETGEVEWMEVAGNSNAGTSVAFLERLRGRRGGGLTVIWDNAPAHGGEALREYLKTPDLNLRLVNPVSSTGPARNCSRLRERRWFAVDILYWTGCWERAEWAGDPRKSEQLRRLCRATARTATLRFLTNRAIWGWAREEATGNLCLGTRAAVQERVGNFLAGLASRKDEVRRRCRTVLQSRAETLLPDCRPDPRRPANAHPTLALV